jgi:hypothetical protein
VGIVSALLNYKSLTPGTREYGRAFEHFILQECWAYSHYSNIEFPSASGERLAGRKSISSWGMLTLPPKSNLLKTSGTDQKVFISFVKRKNAKNRLSSQGSHYPESWI